METLVLIIMLLVSFSFILKLTQHGLTGTVVTTVVVALFAGMSWKYAAGMSKMQIADWLGNQSLMLDTAVFVVVDVACQIAFCFLHARVYAGERLPRFQAVVWQILKWLPGLLIFPVLLSMLTTAIFSMSGVDFALIGWGLAGVLTVCVPLAVVAVRTLFPEEDMRLELLFLVNIIILSLGVIATVNGRTASNGTGAVEWAALAAVVALLLTGAAAGIVINRYK